MNSLGKNYLAALAVFAVVLWLLLAQRGRELDHLGPKYGVTQPQPQEEPLAPVAPAENLKPPTPTLEVPAPPSKPSIDLSPSTPASQ